MPCLLQVLAAVPDGQRVGPGARLVRECQEFVERRARVDPVLPTGALLRASAAHDLELLRLLEDILSETKTLLLHGMIP